MISVHLNIVRMDGTLSGSPPKSIHAQPRWRPRSRSSAVLGRGELSLCESLAEARPTRHNVSQRPCPRLYRGKPACVGHRAEASLAQPRRASCDLPFALVSVKVSCGVPCGVDGSPSSRSQNCSCVCGCGCVCVCVCVCVSSCVSSAHTRETESL